MLVCDEVEQRVELEVEWREIDRTGPKERYTLYTNAYQHATTEYVQY